MAATELLTDAGARDSAGEELIAACADVDAREVVDGLFGAATVDG